jgi:hypothetical protein
VERSPSRKTQSRSRSWDFPDDYADDPSKICTDNCIWTINDPYTEGLSSTYGMLRGGVNLIRLTSTTSQTSSRTRLFVVSGKLEFIGRGLKLVDEGDKLLVQHD